MDIVYLDRLSFQPTDAQGVPTGDPEIVTRGNPVPDYVPPFMRNALINSGAVVQIGDDLTTEQVSRRFAPAEQQVRPLPNPEVPGTPDGQPPLLNLSGDPADHDTGDQGDTAFSDADRTAQPGQQWSADREDSGSEPAADSEPALDKPSTRDSKQSWEDYAVSTGMDRADAESKTKAELIAEVEGRENA